MFGWFNKPETQSYDAIPDRPEMDKTVLHASGLRSGMWVRTGTSVGIITACLNTGMVVVTLVKPDGTTLMHIDPSGVVVPTTEQHAVGSLTQASIGDIPESRRTSVDAMVAMGYTQGNS